MERISFCWKTRSQGFSVWPVQRISLQEPENGVKVILAAVYEALTEKGYNPVDQIVGYIMSGDPTYITSHKNARGMIMRAERDELVEEMLKEYIKNNNWDKR